MPLCNCSTDHKERKTMTQVGLSWDILLGHFLLYVFSDFLISNLHVLSAILTPESRGGQLCFILSLFYEKHLVE